MIFLCKNKNKYLLTLLLFLFIFFIGFTLFVKFSNKINTKNSLNSSLNKIKIKEHFNRIDESTKPIVNDIFFNKIVSNNITDTTIYVGGSNLIDSAGDTSALVLSNDMGKTWKSVAYFKDPVHTAWTSNPIVYKITTEWYTNKKRDNTVGTSDTIIATGKNFKSIAIKNTGGPTTSGQIAWEQVYYAKEGTTLNKATSGWADVQQLDSIEDGNGEIINEKVINATTIKSSVSLSISSKSNDVEQNHIYIITNDETINVNAISSIPYDGNTTWRPKFKIYDIVVCDNPYAANITPYITLDYLKEFTHALNPLSIYGKPSSDNKTVDIKTTFNSELSSFVFKSGLYKIDPVSKITTFNNNCYLVENQHYDSNTSKHYKAYDNPMIVKYSIESKTYTFLVLDSSDNKYLNVFDNCLIKTIALNSINPYDDEKNNNNFLILGGQKNDKGCILSPLLIESDSSPLFPTAPPVDITTVNSKDGSYISKIISFPSHHIVGNNLLLRLVVFGKNISTSNQNLFLSNLNWIFQTNNQPTISNQGLLLAKISLVKKQSSKQYNATVKYSTGASFFKKTDDISEINFIDESDNYSDLLNNSITSNNYNFFASVAFNTLHKTPSNQNFINLSVSKNGNNFVLPGQRNIINHIIIFIIILVLAILVLFLLILLLFVIKWSVIYKRE